MTCSFGLRLRSEARSLDVPVVIVTPEIHPWSKSGGLAIVAAQCGKGNDSFFTRF